MGSRIIDSHHHFWDLKKFNYDWMPLEDGVLRKNYLPEDIRPILQKNGIDQTVLVQAHESLQEAKWFLGLAEQNDFIAGVVAWVDLLDPDVGYVLDELLKYPKFVGVRHGVEHDPDQEWLIRDSSKRGLKELSDRSIRFDMLTRPHQLKHVLIVADEIPDLMMVIDHISKPPISTGVLEPWASDIARVADIPGIYCKVSGMVTEADHQNWEYDHFNPYIKHILDVFGIDRLMFGSDWPVCLLAGSYEDVLQVALRGLGDLSDEQKRMFMGDNAARFYGLS